MVPVIGNSNARLSVFTIEREICVPCSSCSRKVIPHSAVEGNVVLISILLRPTFSHENGTSPDGPLVVGTTVLRAPAALSSFTCTPAVFVTRLRKGHGT